MVALPASLVPYLHDVRTLWGIAGLTLVIVLSSRTLGRGAPETYRRGVLVEDAGPRGLRLPFGRRSCRQQGGRRQQMLPPITLGGNLVPFADETRHFKMVGTTGTGKSTAIAELLGGALARGDRVVLADPDGGYQRRFSDRYRGDVVLNPSDRQSVRWEPFDEIYDSYDVDALSLGLIPSSGDASSNEWRTYARTFLSAILRRCMRTRGRNVAELWRLLAVASSDELRGVVAGTPAQPFLDPDNGRMFGSIRAVAVSALAALEHVQAQRSAPFSVRRWVRTASGSGALFMPYKAGQVAALGAMIATWMRLAIYETMNGELNRDQRLWFVVDELDALGAIDGLKDALARLRKFGGRCVLGFQSVAQVSGTYGSAAAQTIVENCGNSLILRCSSGENGGTSQFASKLIGEREVIRRQTTRGRDREGLWAARSTRRSQNVSEQHVTEIAVMASQIEQLPDLCGYLKLASDAGWRRVAIRSPGRGGHPFS